MTFSRHSIQITETETEFLLSIHASRKERAKEIPSYRWDTERRCWVYPKTARSYDALIDEFGDDLIGDLTITRPSKPAQTKTEDLQIENQGFKEEILEIRKTLELISGKASDSRISETHALQSTLAAKEIELTEIRHRTQDLERRIEEQRSETQEYFKEVKRLRGANQRFQQELEQHSNHGSQAHIQQWLRETIKDATGRNEKFCLIADQLRFDATLPIQLLKELRSELRRVLNCDDQNATMYDLLAQAQDAGVLNARGINLAHLIRRQRNIVAHEVTDEYALQVRTLLCLFAAALLWTEFTE